MPDKFRDMDYMGMVMVVLDNNDLDLWDNMALLVHLGIGMEFHADRVLSKALAKFLHYQYLLVGVHREDMGMVKDFGLDLSIRQKYQIEIFETIAEEVLDRLGIVHW
jgi:hypothetical protein